jgi:lysophospholipase L1-like esterase
MAVVATAAALALGACSTAEPTEPPGAAATSSTASTSVSVPSTTTSTSTSTTGAPADGWYLALGDSLAAGLQPTTGDQKTRGYAGPVLEGVRKTQPGTQLTNLGCSGETTTTMLRGGLCRYPEGSQTAAAVAFLKANAATTRLVTLDMGANNVLRCARPAVDQACATSTTATVSTELTSILGQLRAVAPDVEIVLLTYYDPLLAAWRQGPEGQAVAAQSLPLLGALNAQIATVAAAARAKVADVAGAFATSDGSGSPQPTNVTRICDWTWMCSRNDIHANDAGYAAMAAAVLAAR